MSNIEVHFFRKRTGLWSARVEWNGGGETIHSITSDLSEAAMSIGISIGIICDVGDAVHSTDADQ